MRRECDSGGGSAKRPRLQREGDATSTQRRDEAVSRAAAALAQADHLLIVAGAGMGMSRRASTSGGP